MPNRIIKESICMSENLAGLPAEAEVLFYRLIVKADDYGRYYANPKIVSNTCYPLHPPKASSVERWLKQLVESGLIQIYIGDDGREYLIFLSWGKHQQVRSKKSKFPAPDSTCNQMISDDIKCKQMQANVPVIENENDIVIENENEFDTFCAEQAPAPEPEPIITLTLNDKSEYPITQTMVDEWAGLYPGVDVMQELRNMRGWLNANTTRRKTKAGILRFVTGWLAREQNKSKGVTGNGPQNPGGNREVPKLPRAIEV